jgi:trehalose 6-phosphate phosphatase
MALPAIPLSSNSALFLDFDGTLVEIADHPENVKLEASTRIALERLSCSLGGAVAIITGREIDVIDRFTAPLQVPVAGIHGLARRDALGNLVPVVSENGFAETVEKNLAPLVAHEPGLLLERKTSSVALHYRARPDLEGACLAAFEAALAGMSGIELKRGKMVLEAKPNGADKGTAVLDFLKEAPFRGRTAWFAGDDVTDEDAFAEVNRLGGVSIKVGEGPTIAQYRAESTAAFLAWLEASALQLAPEEKI